MSHSGLSETEILGLSGAAPVYWSQIFNAIAGHVITRNGLVTFSHGFIREAVHKRYLPDQDAETGYRRRIAAYMENNTVSPNGKYNELPHQLYVLKEWDRLYRFLLDFDVFEYLYGKDLYELGKYWRALQEENRERYSLEKYAGLSVSGKSKEAQPVLFSTMGHALINTLEEYYPLALKFALRALAIRKEIMENQPDTVTVRVMIPVIAAVVQSYHQAGRVYYLLGDYPAALEHYQEAFMIGEDMGLGGGYEEEVRFYNDTGDLYYASGNYKEALIRYQRAAKISKEYLKDDDPDMAASFYNIGTVYNFLGDYMAALDNHRKALDIRKEAFGENHPDTALSYMGIGGVFHSIDAYRVALEWYQKALAIGEQLFGIKHRLTAEALFNSGRTYSAQNDYPKALDNYRQALAIYEELAGKDHPDTQKVRDSITAALEKLGKTE
jgi:tetratricopeptide (TPR) repeat protein